MISQFNLVLHFDECQLNNQTHKLESSQYIMLFLIEVLIAIRIIMIYRQHLPMLLPFL